MAEVSGGQRLSVSTFPNRALLNHNDGTWDTARAQTGFMHQCLGRFIFEHTPSGTDDFTFNFGGQKFWDATADEMAVISWRWSGSAAELVFRTRTGSGSITSTVLTSPTIGTPIDLGVLLTGATSASAIINGSIVATHTTNLPINVGFSFGCPVLFKNAGSNARTVVVDNLRMHTWRV
jgi:hypothetical protein